MKARQTLSKFKTMLNVAIVDVDHIIHFESTIKESVAFILNYSEQYPEGVDEKTTEDTFDFIVRELKEFTLTELADTLYSTEWDDEDAPKIGTPSDWFNFLTLNHANDDSPDEYKQQVLYFAKQMKPRK